MTDEPKTPDQEAGAGAEETGPSTDERLAMLEERLETESTARMVAEQKADREAARAMKLQASRDRTRSRLDKLQQTRIDQSARPGQPGQQQTDVDIREFANDQAREAMKLRKLMDHGLTEDDLDPDIDYATPAELDAAIRIAKIEKKIADQDQQQEVTVDADKLSAQALAEAAAQPASPAPVDTGGPTGIAPDIEPSSPEAMRERAKELRKRGDAQSLEKARWLVLQASYADPDKSIGRGRGGATTEG